MSTRFTFTHFHLLLTPDAHSYMFPPPFSFSCNHFPSTPSPPFPSPLSSFFHYNYFIGSIPSTIASLPQLTSLGLFSNYLTGTVPVPSKSLLALDLGFNFLSGTFPKLALMFCAGDNNCFLNSTACRTYGIVQRPAGACAICGTAAGQGDLCFGGSCAPSSAAAVSAGTINSPNQPLLPMACAGGCAVEACGCPLFPNSSSHVAPFSLSARSRSPLADNPATPMDTGSGESSSTTCPATMHSCIGAPFSHALHLPRCFPALSCTVPCATVTHSLGLISSSLSLLSHLSSPSYPSAALALLNVKAALGVTFTSWNSASPCAVVNASLTVGVTWTGLGCHLRLHSSPSSAPRSREHAHGTHRNLSMAALTCTMHADISKLSALTYLSVPSPTCTHLTRLHSTHLCSDLSKNVLRANLDSFTSAFSALKTLQQLSVPPSPALPSPMLLSPMLLSPMLLSTMLLSPALPSALLSPELHSPALH
ncbi:unnamed protein product [Closterium sp. Naga37s-1]|nr:unnamed protein product [Closterium sp. Naga37s-1]